MVVVVLVLVVMVAVVLVVVLVVAMADSSLNTPLRPFAPGPGKSSMLSIAAFPVAGMQKTEARFELCGRPSERLPAGMPVSVMHWVVGWPKAPASVCEGQNIPVAAVLEAVPVVSGVRSTGSGAWKPGSDGRQSMVVSWLPVGVQTALVSGLNVFVFVFQLGSQCPERHFGHGEAVLPVM